MNVFIAGLYAVTVWLSAVAYCAITGGDLRLVVVLAPVIVSGMIIAILALDLLIDVLCRGVVSFRSRRRRV